MRASRQSLHSAFTDLNVLPNYVSHAESAHGCPAHIMHAKKPTD
jgi:hypothetical protein